MSGASIHRDDSRFGTGRNVRLDGSGGTFAFLGGLTAPLVFKPAGFSAWSLIQINRERQRNKLKQTQTSRLGFGGARGIEKFRP
jgi:hypothetical protein